MIQKETAISNKYRLSMKNTKKLMKIRQKFRKPPKLKKNERYKRKQTKQVNAGIPRGDR